MSTTRATQLFTVLNEAWVSSRDLQRVLGWRGPDGEPLTGPAFAQALCQAGLKLLRAGEIERKSGPMPAGRGRMAWYRRAKKGKADVRERQAAGFYRS